MEDSGAVLKHLVKTLYSRVNILMKIPVMGARPGQEKDISQQVRLLKDLIMDIAELEHKIERNPQILIQNYMGLQQDMMTFLATDLCECCKNKAIKYLKVPAIERRS
jgi:hypothetical protein